MKALFGFALVSALALPSLTTRAQSSPDSSGHAADAASAAAAPSTGVVDIQQAVLLRAQQRLNALTHEQKLAIVSEAIAQSESYKAKKPRTSIDNQKTTNMLGMFSSVISNVSASINASPFSIGNLDATRSKISNLLAASKILGAEAYIIIPRGAGLVNPPANPLASPPVAVGTAPASLGAAPAPPAPALNVGQYSPEFVVQILNKSFPVCDDGVWMTTDFAYRAKVDHVQSDIRSLAPSVGMFTYYGQDGGSGIPLPQNLAPAFAAAGSGVAIAPNLVLTNRHVVRLMADPDSIQAGLWTINSKKYRVIISFPIETSACQAAAQRSYFEVVKVIWVGENDNSDIAVIQVKPLNGGSLKPVKFDTHESYNDEEDVGVVGYPDKPDPIFYLPPTGSGIFSNSDQMESYFDLPNKKTPKYKIERFGNGTLYPLDTVYFGHDAPTDNSSSGSLMISLATGMPIGIHSGGNQPGPGYAGMNKAIRASYIIDKLTSAGFGYKP